MDAVNIVLALGAAIAVIAILSSLAALRIGAPILIAFLGVGMAAGREGLGGLVITDYGANFVIGSVALAIILFDGGMRTRLSRIGRALWPGLTLATFGVLITASIIGAIAYLVLGLPWLESVLLGSTVASTDAAAVFFLLHAHGLKVEHRVAATLELESATNDPVAVFLTMALVGMIATSTRPSAVGLMVDFLRQGVLGGAMGLAGGLACSWILNRAEMPASLRSPFALVSAILVCSATSAVGGSGFLAAYIAGVIVGNRPLPGSARLLGFLEAMAWFAQMVMLIVLGILATPSRLVAFAGPALVVALSLMLVARPMSVWLCLAPFGFRRRERLFISATGLRGAIGVFLASVPILYGVPNGELYFNVAFVVVLASLVLQGWTAAPIARRLRLVAPEIPAPRRIELEPRAGLPEEMVGYPVLDGAEILKGAALPDRLRPVLVVRGKRALLPEEAGALVPGDFVYILAPQRKLPDLDRIFAPEAMAATHPTGPSFLPWRRPRARHGT